MVDFKEVCNQLDNMEKSRKTASNAIKEIFQDKSLDLDQRWQIYAKAVKGKIFHEEKYYTIDFKFCEKHGWDSWYDDFYLERHQTQCLLNLVENIVERWWDKAISYEGGKVTQLLADAEFEEDIAIDLDEIKEEILQCGYSSFIMDW